MSEVSEPELEDERLTRNLRGEIREDLAGLGNRLRWRGGDSLDESIRGRISTDPEACLFSCEPRRQDRESEESSFRVAKDLARLLEDVVTFLDRRDERQGMLDRRVRRGVSEGGESVQEIPQRLLSLGAICRVRCNLEDLFDRRRPIETKVEEQFCCVPTTRVSIFGSERKRPKSSPSSE